MSSSPSKRGVGLNAGSRVHYIDHLGIICIIMEIPLLVVEEIDQKTALHYYPEIKCEFTPFQHFSPEFLIAHYDVLYMSDLWDRDTIREKFAPLEKRYKKTIRNVHVPHGYSDKGFYLRKVAKEDIALLYGQNMLDMLEQEGVKQDLRDYVITGNYRYTYYKKHKVFYDKIVHEEVVGRFGKKQPTILYAPTWLDLEESSTFFSSCDEILGRLPDHYNMIVKLHPRLELDDTINYYRILGKYDHKPNVLFLNNYPIVYPFLDFCDIYLGDMSSIGYDFLAFNKPMFFLNAKNRHAERDRGLYLFRCGVEVKAEQFSNLYPLIEQSLPYDKERYSAIRQEVYHYTFGEERPFSDIKADILRILG